MTFPTVMIKMSSCADYQSRRASRFHSVNPFPPK